jgi:hypothetical protein
MEIKVLPDGKIITEASLCIVVRLEIILGKLSMNHLMFQMAIFSVKDVHVTLLL